MRPAMMTMRAESAQGKLFLENMFIVVWLFGCLVVWLFCCLVVWFFAVRSGRAERFGGLVVWVSRVDTRDTGAGEYLVVLLVLCKQSGRAERVV